MGTPPPLAADPTRRSSTLTALPVVVDDAHRAGLHAAAHVHGAGAVVDAVKRLLRSAEGPAGRGRTIPLVTACAVMSRHARPRDGSEPSQRRCA
jgi:hypothetical protein